MVGGDKYSLLSIQSLERFFLFFKVVLFCLFLNGFICKTFC